MEILGIIEVPMWLILCICILVGIAYYGVQPFSVWTTYGIDGPKPVPFVGNVLQLHNPKSNVHNCIDKWKRKYGSVFGIYQFRQHTLVVSDPEILKEIFVKNFSNFHDRGVHFNLDTFNLATTKSLVFAKGDNWRRLRHIVNPTFSIGKLKTLTHHVNYTAKQLSDNFLKNANGQCTIDARNFFASFSLDTFAGVAFSLKIDSQKDFDQPFVKNSNALCNFTPFHRIVMCIEGVFPPLVSLLKYLGISLIDSNVSKFFDKWVHSMIKERKDNSGREKFSDFVNLLLEAESEDDTFQHNNKLSHNEIVSQIIMFLLAGYETSSTALQFLTYELAKNKSIQDKIVAEAREIIGDSENPTYEQLQNMKYTTAVITEGLRMYPSITMITRKCDHACTIGGFDIPAKTGVFVPVSNICRDPQLFEQPDEFRPERFLDNGDALSASNPLTQLWFGSGPRVCVGARLSMINMKLGLVHVLSKVVIVKALPDLLETDDFSTILVPKQPIKLAVQTRNNH